MKFSDDTVSILKNFSGINQGLLFKPGNTLTTISPQQTVMASATISETLDGRAAVYDLSRFLSTVSLFNDSVDVKFGSEKFEIRDDRRKVSYVYAAENMIVTPPEKQMKLPNADVTVDIKWIDIESAIRGAGVLQVSDIAFTGANGKILLRAVDSKNSTSDTYDIEISDYDGEDFEMTIKVDNLKLLPADYTVSLSKAGISHFKSTNVQYWIAVQAN